jgi:deoxyribodipyrimidine photo-lyase
MAQTYNHGLFIFHRDLRTVDNIGFIAAISQCTHLYTCFIFTPEQVGKNNSYKSNNAVQFMIESLDELHTNIQKQGGELITLYGKTTKMTQELIETLGIDCVFFNSDYTPYALERDNGIRELCKKMKIACQTYHDYYLHEPGTIRNGQGGYYHKFTPFYEEVIKHSVQVPSRGQIYKNLKRTTSRLGNHISLQGAMEQFTKKNPFISVPGGRTNGIRCLTKALSNQKEYAEHRDEFIYKTTMLSAYFKFGCISVREAYHGFKKHFGLHHEIIRQMVWRDFFAHILFGYPETVEHTYNPNFRRIRWKTNKRHLELWKIGKTGVPLVDACMRQMNTTGYMHNRGRMVVATFLIKTLLLDWHEGEKYFAQKLTDYDVASNNGNWQSIMGGGVYSMPYFRVMNPWMLNYGYRNYAMFRREIFIDGQRCMAILNTKISIIRDRLSIMTRGKKIFWNCMIRIADCNIVIIHLE